MRNAGFDLKSLQTVLTLADTGNMTLAARQLGMTQPAVSHAVKTLEEHFGMALFDRRLRPLRPTPAGSILIDRARRLLSEADQIDALVRGSDSSAVPQASIGLIDSFSATVGPKLIHSLQQQAQQLLVWSGISPGLESELLRRSLDFIVSPNPLEEFNDLENTLLYREPFVLVLPASEPTKTDKISLQSLVESKPLVRYSRRSRIGAQIEQHLRWLRLDAPSRLEFDGTETVIPMVAEGLGWAITTPLCLIHAKAHLSRLRSLPLPEPELTRSLYLVNHKGEFSDFKKRIIKRSGAILRQIVKDELPTRHRWMTDRLKIF